MYEPTQNCFRRDLVIDQTLKDGQMCYLVKDPRTGETYEFGEEEYYLCRLMDGKRTPRQILSDFESRFGLTISEADFEPFSHQIATYGLLETCGSGGVAVAARPKSDSSIAFKDADGSEQTKKAYKWYFPWMAPVFTVVAQGLSPFHLIFKFISLLLIPALPLAVLTLLNNQTVFFRDFNNYVSPVGGFVRHFVNMLAVNFLAKTSMAIVVAHYGVPMRKFGLQLVFGFFPRFNVAKDPIFRYLSREEQMWTFATPLLLRAVIFCLGIFLWFLNRGGGNSLAAWAVSWSFLAFIDIVIDINPLLPGDAYGWVVNYYRWPPNLYKRNLQIIERMIRFQGLPSTIALGERIRLLVAAIAIGISWSALFIFITLHSAESLMELIPGLLGQGLGVLLFCLPFPLALRWWFVVRDRTNSQNTSSNLGNDSPGAIAPTSGEGNLQYTGASTALQRPAPPADPWVTVRKILPWALLVLFIIVLLLPYTYHYGGAIQLLPPRQEKITPEVEGTLEKIYFKGGDPAYIKAGTPLAVLHSSDTDNKVKTTLQQVSMQQAALAKDQQELEKLLHTPRPEDVQVALQQVEVAKKDLTVAQAQLQTDQSQAAFEDRNASRQLALYQDGAAAFETYDNAKKQAETSRIQVLKSQQAVASAQQSVSRAEANLRQVKAGPYPQEIEAARKQVDQDAADLRRLEQELTYWKQQFAYTTIKMPFDGYLVTPNLDFKVGSRLKQGDVLAVAESARKIVGTLQMPEYQVGEGGFKVGNEVEVKLWAYPNESFKGKVTSIEPVATALDDPNKSGRVSYGADPNADVTSTARYVNVNVEVPNAKGLMKSGMTGYAKITGNTETVIQAFTHPVVRFFKIELWSWLP